MNRTKVLVLPLALAIVPLAACKSRQEAPPPSSTKPVEPGAPPIAQPTNPSGDVSADFAQDRDRVLQQMQAKLSDLDAKLAALRQELAAGSGRLTAAGKAELADAITKLEDSRDKAQVALEQAKHSTAEGWDQVKLHTSEALQRAADAYDAAVRELRK